jgi:methyl-accepting chemotaxis protein
VGAGGTWWVIGTRAVPSAPLDLAALVSWLAVVAGLALLSGVLCALWLDRGIVTHLRGLQEGMRTGQVTRLRGLPSSTGWGELSLLTDSVQGLLSQHRQVVRATDELGLMRGQLAQLRETLERWNESERWGEVWAEGGPIAQVALALNRGLRRLDDVREQNLEVARQIRGSLGEIAVEAREGASQAERAFVEATSLLTTVRELQRLEAELTRAIAGDSIAPADPRGGVERAAREAIETLVAGSEESVRHLSEAIAGVHGVGEQVRLVSNRATLIALDTAVAGASGGAVSPAFAADMKQLALEVQGATARVSALIESIERAAGTAMTRMREARGRVAERLASLPEATVGPAAAGGDTERLLERVREMISDAASKSERLSASGERVSRAADRLVRELEQEQGELEGLEVRLAPPGAESATHAPPAEPRAKGLRLLGEEPVAGDDAGGAAQGGTREDRT